MSLTVITSGLRTFSAAILALPTAEGGLGLAQGQVAWPNVLFSPPNGLPYAEVSIIPNNSSVVTLGDGGEDEYTGVLQIALYFPLEAGDGALIRACDTLRTFFVAGVPLVTGESGEGAVVNSFDVTPPKKIGSRYTSYVTIYWFARIQRSANTMNSSLVLLALIGGSDPFFSACAYLTTTVNNLPNKLN